MDGIGRTHARILAALWALEGKAWLEVQSEIHGDYKELPFWILLAADTPPIDAHRQFWRVLEPELTQLGDYHATVSYKAIANGCVLWHGFFNDPTTMRHALTPDGWAKPVRQELSGASIFRTIQSASVTSEASPTRQTRRERSDLTQDSERQCAPACHTKPPGCRATGR